ncbi:MAG: ACT domain-containing protein [Anaerolineales bacterium]|nr:ACT domain-containing protein [Anaerolineales bacterium]
MATDLRVHLQNRPGSLAEAGEALGNAGVNIEGVFAYSKGDDSFAHLLVEDAAAARQALEGAGFTVEGQQDVVVAEVQDRPGVLGEVCRQAADAGVNLSLTYLATDTRLVLAGDDLAALREAAGG